tara:strand:- start:614 stop:862 length:249 start_codon:yes stop_codon:yes gene_type:complete
MYSFKISNLNRINNYLEIFKENFKGHFFSKKYLNWLSKKNLEIPLFIRPSPLHFIYRIINKSKLKEKNFKDIQFLLDNLDVY